MKAHGIVIALALIGAASVTEAAPIAQAPTVAITAAETCRAAWPAEKPESIEFGGQKIQLLRAEFIQPKTSVLCMRGTFWRDTPEKIQQIANPGAIKSFVIDSPGGLTEPAIDLAKVAERYGWLIIVQGQCLSSCANYVFLARIKKVVLPQSVVGWHGLPPEPNELSASDFEKQKASIGPTWADVNFDMVRTWSLHSKEFFAERAIPPALGRTRPQVGHAKDYVERLNALGTSGASPFWSYGRTTLEKKFNVRDILYMWEPQTPEEGTALAMKQFGANLFFFDLSRSK